MYGLIEPDPPQPIDSAHLALVYSYAYLGSIQAHAHAHIARKDAERAVASFARLVRNGAQETSQEETDERKHGTR